MYWHLVLSIILFTSVLWLIIWQPYKLSIGWIAAIGGGLAVILGLVSLANVLQVVSLVWDATLTFIALIIISLILDELGFFEWAALHIIQYSKGQGRRLFVLIVVLGAAVSMFFANDGAALILTPIVYQQTKALKLHPNATLALIMACGFIADTTSVPLVISNLVNILSADFFHLAFASYALRMVPVDLVAFASSLLMLFIVYRKSLPKTFTSVGLPNPSEVIGDPLLFSRAWWILGLLFLGYFLSQAIHWPVSVFAGTGAIALLAASRQSPAIHTRRILLEAPWRIVIFSIGMYIVVFSLRNVGLTQLLSNMLTVIAHYGSGATIIGTGMVAAILSSVMNNLPSVMVGAIAIRDAGIPSLHSVMAYANIVGCDLGTKITPIGSLATLLWLHVLDRRGMHISWQYYVKVGIVLTIPVLLATLLALWGWSEVLV
ncbi:MAG: arsenical efflux pump membrane protein ArsB [Sulfobacillus benefaciens]|uniref:Arsenical pump membrane protein n=1 Tax=Sulfobacillus benefaciens TaxID=453960 RepID=A0A2T2XFY1_9FIRM|nr:MAG: arsenical efflux pump membrane protein ArsB [Sulfobacillus benefaciens]